MSHAALRAAEQGDAADEAGASDGASQLTPCVRWTVVERRGHVFTFRPTAKLARRLGMRPAPPVAATTGLGDWYANLIYHGPRQLILCTSDRSLLSVVLPARDAKRSLPTDLPAGLERVLRAIRVDDRRIREELDAMQQAVVGMPLSRSVLGSMNDFASGLLYRLDDDPAEPLEQLALDLSETPCSPLSYESPRDAARRLLA